MMWFMLNFDADVDKIVIELTTECVDYFKFSTMQLWHFPPQYILFSQCIK